MLPENGAFAWHTRRGMGSFHKGGAVGRSNGGRDGISLRKDRRADGTAVYHARFNVPERSEDGGIIWRRTERSTRTGNRDKALAIAKEWQEQEFKNGYKNRNKKKGVPFNEACIPYLKEKGANKYIAELLREIGHVQIDDITSEFVADLAAKMLPGRSAATINRHVYTPIIAVLNHVETPGWRPPQIKRPKGYLPQSNFKEPPRDWWARVVEIAPPHLSAFVLFTRLHGRRTGEAVRISAADIDRQAWTVTIRDTKTKQTILLHLATPVIEQLERYDWQGAAHVFGYSTRWSARTALKRLCERHGIPYHAPKDAGRHSFASHLLRSGKTLKEVQEAGRWASITMPAKVYGHLEKRAIDDEARRLGEKWHSELTRNNIKDGDP